ncbi:hypothetical protein M407DRAFT_72543 [Tulasnella calospora MUT 4182]|uniref:SAM-dependent MTase RsmB/NOP-type domain-containing protein n=1 Tax=Tulasnella calospora MUT 4182 TaxID=1051891 RepID=A0A0C3QM58_9AGAM|nr:hypothetical protein M407DRAFT_72543 [Tulasnella calospora MUT 4182]
MPEREGEWTTDWANTKFEAYYRYFQKILPEEEWDTFMEYMRKTLPTTFRLPAGKLTTPTIVDIIATVHIPHLSGIEFEGENVDPPRILPWYPRGLGYEFSAPKRVLRKLPEMKEFHQFLVYQTEVGNVSRQEAVSMVPPLLLDVQPHHVVLDACASPGSKTAQLVEALHTRIDPTSGDASFVPFPSGIVIANDSEYTRAQLLVHQSARLPTPSLMVTNLDASLFPTLRTENGEPLLFDRILCDVPCSGDGTLRKNVGIWKKWNVGDGNGLHSLQLRILLRAMNMLRPGGKIVYSTCSMNPIENEAVLAAALNQHPGQYLLAPTSHLLPGLIRRPGLASWKIATGVPSKEAEVLTDEGDLNNHQDFDSYEAYCQATDGGEMKVRFHKSMWPPVNVSELGLENCLRIYPHLQNTGGFFVALMHKLPGSPEATSFPDPTTTSVDLPGDSVPERDDSVLKSPTKRAASPPSQPPLPKKAKMSKNWNSKGTNAKSGMVIGSIGTNPGGAVFKEAPFTFISEADPLLQESLRVHFLQIAISFLKRLHLNSSFPSANVFVRHPPTDFMKTFYFCNSLVKSVILHNPLERIRLVSAGVKAFSRQDMGPAKSLPQLALRFTNEGILTVVDFVDDGVKVHADLETLKSLLSMQFPLLDQLTSGSFAESTRSKPTGSYIVAVKPGKTDDGVLRHTLILPLWKSSTSVSLMVDKQGKSAISLQVFGKDVSVVPKTEEPSAKNQIGDLEDEL